MLNRRKFIRRIILATGGVVAASARVKSASAQDPDPTYVSYLPHVQKAETPTPTPTPVTPTPTTPTPPPTGAARVIHVHAANATNSTYWNSGGWYGDYVNQSAVNTMCDSGVMSVTGQATVAAAWQALLPGYTTGKKIAIKVNFNNNYLCTVPNDRINVIDGLIHPVNGLIRGMKLAGVQENDIWIFDAIRPLPTRFTNNCLYSGVHFFDDGCKEAATFNSTRVDATVSFAPPPGNTYPYVNVPPFSVKLTDVVVNATYLINVCILKGHPAGGISHGFKNHLGSIDSPAELHTTLNYVEYSGNGTPENPGTYRSTYSPLVTLNSNPNIKNKTVLTVGDGLFGSANIDWAPERWSTFGNLAPNSLFFSTDRVAIDTVMADTFRAQFGLDNRAYDYMSLAAAAGLGQYHSIRSGPYPNGYYARIEV